ncbi:lysylphosphatidylglycerol synthase transmembrane domain-containing protein [Uliginosibacterium sp. 31-16]|uniref:lysylphosphatidylglycerol synthase transmembrane domain-containing protein n=1 Tax=Uliginosibacterium sp. 31-16 TaxID=3068315 RepID=UPI00273E0FBC|nr:lysylphosphatidylglycerol synthase transmembrane domain-containing protein [Uliginosibacterium sp. 31-16]MDP5239889.1 lysylphosphatidylglycerol synthase transmembrane domain-containing protein [Uliginosibacterium sp. 31-16]
MKTWLKRGAGLAITLGLLAWVLHGARWQEVGTSLAHISVLELALAIAAFAASYLLRAARVHDEFAEETGARFVAILRLTLLHNASINILPFRSGEATFPILLNRWFGVPSTRAVVALLWLRIQDAFVVLALAAFVWPNLHPALRAAWIAAVVFAAWLIPVWAARHPELEARAGKLATTVHRIRAALAESTRHHGRGWLWTIANWSLKLAAQAWLLGALLQDSVWTGLSGALGVELAAILPIQGVAGFGTYEAGGAALLAPHGIPFAAGLNAALALHLFVIASALVAGGLALAFLPAAEPASKLESPQP